MNTFRQVLPVNSLYGPSPRPRSGGSYGLETVAAHGKAQASQEQINNLDKGGR